MTWSGNFIFGETWAAYRGSVAQTSLHAHAAVQLIVGKPGDFVVTDELNRKIAASAVVVGPGIKHRLSGTGLVSVLYIEPSSPIAFALSDHINTNGVVGLAQEVAREIDVRKHPSEWLTWLVDEDDRPQKSADERLAVAMKFLSTLRSEHTIKLAAVECGLSESRLRVLARQQLGFPLSTWLIWRKLGRASKALSSGANLAQAAQDGGFADQAHFSRVMRRMFGISPSIAGGILNKQTDRKSPKSRN